MDIQRITISLPGYLYQQLIALAPSRKVSAFVAEAIEEKVSVARITKKDPVVDFLALRRKLPKFTDQAIYEAINRGRE